MYIKRHSFTTFVFVCYLVLCNVTGAWGMLLRAWWRLYRWTRRQLLFFTCFPHRGHRNGPWSPPWTSRICTLRLNLFLKPRAHRGHSIMYTALDNQPVQTQKHYINLRHSYFIVLVYIRKARYVLQKHISSNAWN